MKVIVVGAVAGGPSFATRLRRLDEQAEIIMLERGNDISYAGCAIPYYLGGVIANRDDLIERTPAGLKTKNNIDVRVRNEVTNINVSRHEVTVKTPTTVYQEHYDKLILATGARPVLPPIDGVDSATNLFMVRSVSDADKIQNFIQEHQPQRVTIVGAGVAGLELAENLTRRGLSVTLIEQADHVAFPYDTEIADVVADELNKRHVTVRLDTKVETVRQQGKLLELSNGANMTTDLLIFTTGVTPNNEVAEVAGIKLAPDGHIIVNNRLQTNVPDIYAIGDVIETTSMITGQLTPSMLSTAANRQGHLLADIIHGADLTYRGFIGTGVAKVFNLTLSSVGFTEATLKLAGITHYETVFVTPFNYAYFYPGATRVNFKLIYQPDTGQILGGQAVGHEGIDKRIGQLSAAITGGLTVADLPAIEVPYSPPFSSTRDVINIAGYVALNQMQQVGNTVKLADISELALKTATFLDVREPGKHTSGSVTPTLKIPLSQLRDRVSEVPRDMTLYLTYRPGLSNYTAARILAGNGISAIIIDER